MKKFTKDIAAKIIGSDAVRVDRSGKWTTVQWGQSMSQIGSGYRYLLSWTYQDNQLVWIERDSDYNIKENTGITCICDDLNLEGDGLFVTLETLEQEKPEITAAAAKIYNEQSAQALKGKKEVVIAREDAVPGKVFAELEVQRPAEIGIGYHGSYTLKNVKIKKVISNFNAVGPGSMRVSRVIVSEQEGN